MNIPFILSKMQKIDVVKEEGHRPTFEGRRPITFEGDRPTFEGSRPTFEGRRPVAFEGKDVNEMIKTIDDQIEQKKQILFSKRQFLDQTVKQNEYLQLVRNDYQKYHNEMLKSKQMQLDSMNMIKKHLDALIVKGGLTDEEVEKAQKDQKDILSELEKIRGELNGLIEEK
jgi:hypothetical protein